MGKRYDAERVYAAIEDLGADLDQYRDRARTLEFGFGRYYRNETYIGRAADASKEFIDKGQMKKLHDVNLEIQSELYKRCANTYEVFKEMVDPSPKARTDTDVLLDLDKIFRRFGDGISDVGYEIECVTREVANEFGEYADFYPVTYNAVRYAHDELCGHGGHFEKCINKIEEFDEYVSSSIRNYGLLEADNELQSKLLCLMSSLDAMKVFEPSVAKKVIKLVELAAGSAIGKGLSKIDLDKIMASLKNSKMCLTGMAPWCQAIGYDPVNLNSGNYLNDREDLNISGIYPLSVRRFYNALSDRKGFFGRGWTSLFDVQLSKEGEGDDSKIKILLSDGREGSYIRLKDKDAKESIGKEEKEYIEEHGENGILVEYKDSYKLVRDDGTYTEFDKNGKVAAFGNARCELARVEYKDGLPTGISAGSKFIKLIFDENGLVGGVKDNTGRGVKYEYADRGGEFYLTGVYYPDGSIRRYDYDADGIMNEVTNPVGTTFLRNEYDDEKRISKQSFPDGGVISYAYDEDNHITTATEQNGLKVEYYSDDEGRHVGTRYPEQGLKESYTYNDKNLKTSVTDKRGYTSRFSYDNRGHLTKVIDANGNITNITYNAFGKPIVVKGSDGATYKYSYDDYGQLISVINPLMEEHRLYYNEDGQITKIQDADGAETFLEYDKNKDICYVKDSTGVETFYERDELGRVISTKNALGAVTIYEYDPMDRISKVIDPLGNQTRYVYNRSGKLTRVINPDGTAKSWEYNNIGKPSVFTDEAGRKTQISYNKVWDEEEVTLPNGGKISYEYDLLKRLIKVTDPEHREVTYDYDENDNVIAEYNGDIKVRSLTYDAIGNITSETDALGHTKTYEYDVNGNLIATTDTLGNKYTREYDLLGKVTKETDALGNSTSYTYTKLGDIESVTDAAGRVRKFEYENGRLSAVYFCDRLEQKLCYDELGRVITRSFADGYKISYVYDALNRIEKVEGSDGRTVSYGYDAMGRATKVADGKSVTLYTYTATGRLKSVVDALGNETAYTYDALDNLKSIHRVEGLINVEERAEQYFPTVGKDGHVTIYSYNLSGQLTELTDALGQKETYEYDQYGRLKKKTDRDNYEKSFEYDSNGFVTKIGYSDGRSVELSYDELSRLNKIKDWLGNTFIENDVLGRITKVTDYRNRTVSYEYNSIGEKTKLIYPDGKEAVYTYDADGRLSGIVGNGAKTRYNYDELGRLTEKILPNGIRQAYSYISGGNLESITSSDKEGILDRYLYSYDNSGLIKGINRKRRGLDSVSGQYSYSYDAIGRLINTTHDGVKKASYEYDAFGNRISLSDNESDVSYTYDVLDRLVQAKEIGSDCNIIKTYAYDNRGNQTKEYVNGLLQKSYNFDATNMLTKAVDIAKGKVENHYNGLGFRVASTRPEEKIEYLCDLSRDYYNLLERTVNGETESFIYDDNVVSMSKSGNNYYYLQDELGSPMYMTGTDGITISSYAFDDFGRSIDPFTGKVRASGNKHAYTTSGNIIQPFAFTGYQEDEVSGLKFAQARFYNAETGRFQSEDNIKGFIDSPFTLNHYGYCWGNPVGFVDIDGNMPEWLLVECLRGLYAHYAIEVDMKLRYSSETNRVESNVFIEGGGIGRTRSGNGFADVIMKSGKTYSVYEIKPASQDVEEFDDKGNIIPTPGQEQLNGYVSAIEKIIVKKGTLGQFGETAFGEKARKGNEEFEGTTTIGFLNKQEITYYSNGDGMIYYEIGGPREQEIPALVKGYAKAKEKGKKLLRGLERNLAQNARRIGQAVIGIGLITVGSLLIVGGGALTLDDGTVVGAWNDIFIPGAFKYGSGLILGGSYMLMKAISGCDG